MLNLRMNPKNLPVFPKTLPHLQFNPDARIVWVFSCPGRAEAKHRRPAAGGTGRHLESVLTSVRLHKGSDDFNRDKMTITNAWDKVIVKSDGQPKTEASDKQIAKRSNLERLRREIGEPKIIIAAGKRAQRAVILAVGPEFEGTILFVPHLSGRGLHRWAKPQEAGLKKLGRWIADNRKSRIAIFR